MIKKYKSFLLFFSLLWVFFSNTKLAYGLEIKDYPRIPFLPIIEQGSELPVFISYFFGLGIYLVGTIAVISLVIGGIRLIASAGNPGAIGDAKERIIGAIIGLVLTLSSVIILQTINPVLVTPSLTPSGEVAGIFYTNGAEDKSAPDSEEDTDNVPAGFESLIYKCAQGAYSPALLVWQFPEENFGGELDAFVERITCGNKTSIIGASSFKWAFETPGIYYFTKTDCEGFMSRANISNTQQIEEPFKDDIKSIKIINDTAYNINYGAILHKEINFRGDCSLPLMESGCEGGCCNVSLPTSSINIFVLNQDKPETSGNGIVFYSKPFGYKTGANSGYFVLSPTAIGEFWRSNPTAIDFTNSYNLVDVPDGEKQLCKNFKNCPGSIKVQGNYLVIPYAQQPESYNLYCQVFDKDVPNLKEEEVTAVQGRILDSIIVIPIK